MHFLRNIPIKQKLTFITMLASGVALLLACLAFATYEQMKFRGRIVRDLSVIAEMTGANSAAGLTFNDSSSVEQTLNSLRAHPHIVRACVYDKSRRPFAKYQRADLTNHFVPPFAEIDGNRFGEQQLDLFQTIVFSGETVGTIYIASDLREVRERVGRYALIVAALLLAGTLVAFLLASRLQRIISQPIAELASTAATVATNKNYAVRAVKQGDDEIGRLIDGFNEMLAQIQERDMALQAARDVLEKRVEERTGELASSVSLLNATLDSTADGILALELSGKVVCTNAKFTAMWGFAASVLDLRDSEEMLGFIASYVNDSEQFTQRIAEIRANPDAEVFDVLELKDGRTFERYIRPQRIDGRSVGMVMSFRDVTERKRAEEELAATHEQLMEASRRAGMAEVATGVLHNVGNVLNSVNVSATLVSDSIRKSKAHSLARVSALLREQSDPAAFFTADPRAKQLPGYLAQLADHLIAEQVTALAEVDLLRRNIDHIKDIVAMQQNYARVSGVTDTVQAVDLVEDALSMNAAALARHDVHVVRDFVEVPPLSVDKHKVLQILINLIRNAKYACEESHRDAKRLTVRVAGGSSRVRISIIDNGVGIPAENMTRIFNHGFTTRKDGHGFGLHSGALAARELGGQLVAQSDGPGLGACFTLDLPVMALHPIHEDHAKVVV